MADAQPMHSPQRHKRRQARFAAFVEAEKAKEGDRLLDVDPRTVMDVMRDEEARAQEEQSEPKVQKKVGMRLATL